MSGGNPKLQPLGGESTQKSCAACGQQFICGAPSAGCWCEELQLAGEVLRELQARYADCLCRRCLSAAALACSGQRTDPKSPGRGESLSGPHNRRFSGRSLPGKMDRGRDFDFVAAGISRAPLSLV